jgi:hypothetical protein
MQRKAITLNSLLENEIIQGPLDSAAIGEEQRFSR